jgi:HrpA-like RNA helicase
VLVFVPGVAEILALLERLGALSEQLAASSSSSRQQEKGQGHGHVRELKSSLKLVAIHGSIPYEEQAAAWEPVAEGQLKVVVATNAAESSITLPDVDVVICLGTRRLVEFDQESGSSRLVTRFVSQASAHQRAGRTARTRPGTVFRLYPGALWEQMLPYDLPEVHSAPLDKVLLEFKTLVQGPVLPVVARLVEPPELARAQAALTTLFEHGLTAGQHARATRRAAGQAARLAARCGWLGSRRSSRRRRSCRRRGRARCST